MAILSMDCFDLIESPKSPDIIKRVETISLQCSSLQEMIIDKLKETDDWISTLQLAKAVFGTLVSESEITPSLNNLYYAGTIKVRFKDPIRKTDPLWKLTSIEHSLD